MKTNRAGLRIIGDAPAPEIEVAEKLVNDTILITLKENEFAALVSFALSVRQCDFVRSKLVKLVNRGDEYGFMSAAKEFHLWNTTGGSVRKYLTERRLKEAALFLMPEVVVNNVKDKT